jgi:acetate kinase
MAIILAFNPGSNSLKFDLVELQKGQRYASSGKHLLNGAFDDIGKEGTVELFRDGKQVLSRKAKYKGIGEAAEAAFQLLKDPILGNFKAASEYELIAIRVVHGGDVFDRATRLDASTRREIEAREKLAPLHNINAIHIADAARRAAASIPVAVAFDTAFHRTIPERAWRYALPREIADRYGIRKFGFHGLSHRYQLEQYACLTGRSIEDISIITLHLESGSSAAAIKNGCSIDTSMGFTPLDGLMMGTRCGSIDPAIFPFLMEEAGMSSEEVSDLLEKKSGLIGVSGVSLDTRILRKRKDAASRQALDMFGYRVKLFVGAYLAALGDAEAVIFSGGIGENTPEVRTNVCEGLGRWGLQLDEDLNARTMSGDARVSTASSVTAAWVIHSEEGLQLAHECAQVQ